MFSQTATAGGQAPSRQKSWGRWAGRLARLLVTLATLALLATLLAAALPRLWGYQSYVIYGSSMEPAIKVGSLILAQPVDVERLLVGDIIAYRSPNEVTVTHRIIAIRDEDGQRFFQTKGDASTSVDPAEVSLEGGVHRLAYKLPYLGYFVDFARSIPGIVLFIALPAAGFVVSSWSKHRGPRREAEAEAAEAPPES